MLSLAAIWFLIIGFQIGLYALLDGADLGIGLLSLMQRRERAHALMMHAIGPIWDANETWLVIAGGTLFGAFPLAYGTILSALYIPIMILIFGLILRATSFEFHEYSTHKTFWSTMFGVGSLFAVIGQGFAVGGLLSGITVTDGVFTGHTFDWFTQISVTVVCGMLLGYVAMGYAYLVRRRVLARPHERLLYPIAVAGFASAYIVALGLLYPHIVPPSITIWDAASSPATLKFMLYGIGPLFPIVLAYNFYLYHVFRSERQHGRSEHYGS